MPISVETNRIGDAGTLVSVIGRDGGIGVRVQGFSLHDPSPARRRAMQAAIRQAQVRARLIAEAAGGRLGPLLGLQDADYREVTIEQPDERVADRSESPPPPAPPPPPIRIDLAPRPIETTVRVMASYAVAP